MAEFKDRNAASDESDQTDECDDEGFVPEAKPPAVVAERFVLLVLLTDLADGVHAETVGARRDGIEKRKRALDHLVALGMRPDDLESAEQRLAWGVRTGQVEGGLAVSTMWRIEGAGVLAWALGLRQSIRPVGEAEEPDSLRSELPTNATTFEAFCRRATVRPLGELLVARHEWATRWFPVEQQGPHEERSRILERIRALRWLTEPEQDELCTTPVH